MPGASNKHLLRPADVTLEHYSSYPEKLLDFHLRREPQRSDKFRKLLCSQNTRPRLDLQFRGIRKRRRKRRLRNQSMRAGDFDFLGLLEKENFAVPEAPYKGWLFKLTPVLEAPGLLRHSAQKSQMEWSRKNVIAIHLNSLIYFYRENRRIEDSIDLNKLSSGFDDVRLADMKFSPSGATLLTVDSRNVVSCYDLGRFRADCRAEEEHSKNGAQYRSGHGGELDLGALLLSGEPTGNGPLFRRALFLQKPKRD